MKTVILTPLFPPDTSKAAVYTKELANRLLQENISVIAYGNLPESVPGIEIHSISKRSGKLLLVFRCIKMLFSQNPDILLVQNGPSSELPALVYSYLVRVKIVYIISDLEAAQKLQSTVQTKITHALQQRSDKTIELPSESNKYLPTEVVPFHTIDPEISIIRERWWQQHISQLCLS